MPLVVPSIVDGLLSSCCESAGLLGCCRECVAAWEQSPAFLPCGKGGHRDQARRDCGVAGDSYSLKGIQPQ